MTHDEDYTFEDKLHWLGEIDRVTVQCGSYGDKFTRWTHDGPYVEYDDYLKHIHIRDEEIKRLQSLIDEVKNIITNRSLHNDSK